MAKTVMVSNVKSEGLKDLQQCLVPFELLLNVKGCIGCFIKFNVSEEVSMICRAVPKRNIYSERVFQVIACHCVTKGLKKGSDPSENTFKIELDDLAILKPTVLENVTVSVILKSVENVLEFRRQKHYAKTVHRLLKQYHFTNQCQLQCVDNPLAKMIGITKIYIENCELHHDEIGIVNCDTLVDINTIESEEKIKLSSQKPVDLGGLDNIFQYLQLIVTEPWTRQEEFAEAGVIYPSGVLLVGPPGCGKTSIVRQLCSATGACLVPMTGADLVSPYEGETEEKLSKVAERAQLLSEEGPCVFFIDEIDSLCPMRTKESKLFNIKLAALVLLVIDKCRRFRNLTLMAATNRPYDLDPALRRSGRFEVEILLNVPSVAERKDILTKCTSLLPADCPGFERVAHATPGFVGADLKSLCEMTSLRIEDLRNEKGKVPSEEIVDTMLSIASSITPSINKNLEFITAKPKAVSVGGLKEVKRQLEEIFVHHTKYADVYDKLKLKRPKGVLLYGPRGCGKTRLVASLASARGCTFITANASHLLSPYVGDSEKRVAALFHAARLAQPTILFIDEIDGIFRSRDGKGNSVHVSILNELLQAMDGANVSATTMQGASHLSNNLSISKDRVLICAATNRPQSLDPALLRPGRFDRLVYVPPPDFEARLDILKIKTSKMSVSPTAILESIASKTDGYTGAELEHLITQAATLSIKEMISRKDIKDVMIEERHISEALKCSSPSVTQKEILAFEEFASK